MGQKEMIVKLIFDQSTDILFLLSLVIVRLNYYVVKILGTRF